MILKLSLKSFQRQNDASNDATMLLTKAKLEPYIRYNNTLFTLLRYACSVNKSLNFYFSVNRILSSFDASLSV